VVLPGLVFSQLLNVGLLWREAIIINVDAKNFTLAIRVDHKLDCRHLLLVYEWVAYL
jgi:hypothetical protein